MAHFCSAFAIVSTHLAGILPAEQTTLDTKAVVIESCTHSVECEKEIAMVLRPGSPADHAAAPMHVNADAHVLTPVPRTLLLWLSVGVAGAVLFTLIYLIEGVTRPGYSAWQQPVSALSLGPGGWVQQANFVVYGVCTLCLAGAWRTVLTGGAGALSYPLLRSLEGLAAMLVGVFSQDPAGYPPGITVTTPTLHSEIHLIGAFVLVGTNVCAFLVMAWHFARDWQWWGWAAYSVLSALLMLVCMALFGMAQQHGGDAGLFERLATSTVTIWGVLLLAHLWAGARFMRPSPAPSQTILPSR
jgi:hypothetical protein